MTARKGANSEEEKAPRRIPPLRPGKASKQIAIQDTDDGNPTVVLSKATARKPTDLLTARRSRATAKGLVIPDSNQTPSWSHEHAESKDLQREETAVEHASSNTESQNPLEAKTVTVTAKESRPAKQQPSRRHVNPRKQAIISYSAPDTSIERLHREATSTSLLWQTPGVFYGDVLSARSAPSMRNSSDVCREILLFTELLTNAGESELKKVPTDFSSVEEYIGVFEPLLFEECRAQSRSVWEELVEPHGKDVHIHVNIRTVNQRERGRTHLHP